MYAINVMNVFGMIRWIDGFMRNGMCIIFKAGHVHMSFYFTLAIQEATLFQTHELTWQTSHPYINERSCYKIRAKFTNYI